MFVLSARSSVRCLHWCIGISYWIRWLLLLTFCCVISHLLRVFIWNTFLLSLSFHHLRRKCIGYAAAAAAVAKKKRFIIFVTLFQSTSFIIHHHHRRSVQTSVNYVRYQRDTQSHTDQKSSDFKWIFVPVNHQWADRKRPISFIKQQSANTSTFGFLSSTFWIWKENRKTTTRWNSHLEKTTRKAANKDEEGKKTTYLVTSHWTRESTDQTTPHITSKTTKRKSNLRATVAWIEAILDVIIIRTG